MSLPAYMFLYDENGMLVSGPCSTPDGVIKYSDSWLRKQEQ